MDLDAAWERAKGKLSRAEFDARVAKEREAFDGLLDDETLALLVLDELGLNDGAFVTLSQLAGRAEATVRVTIERVDPPREFAREGRAPGRVANCVVRDGTGEARLTLWDKDVDKVEDGTLAPGRAVTLVNARVKDTRFGVELHVTPWTAIEVEGQLDPARRKLLADVSDGEDPLALALRAAEEGADAVPPRAKPAGGPLRGLLTYVSPTRPFRRADGGVGFVCDVDVETGEGPVRVVCWDESVKAARAIPLGSPVAVEPLVGKPRGVLVEWHTTPQTRIRIADASAEGGE